MEVLLHKGQAPFPNDCILCCRHLIGLNTLQARVSKRMKVKLGSEYSGLSSKGRGLQIFPSERINLQIAWALVL